MSDSVWQWPLADFRDAIESHAMPGCGAAAAVSAGFGLALALKGLRLSEPEQVASGREALVARGDALRQRLARCADDDVAAFAGYLAAKKLSRDTPAQALRREREVQGAIDEASRVPLAIAQACRDGLALGADALPFTAERFHSDIRAGAQLLHAALLAVLAGLEDNLQGLQDATEREALADASQALCAEAESWLMRLEA